MQPAGPEKRALLLECRGQHGAVAEREPGQRRAKRPASRANAGKRAGVERNVSGEQTKMRNGWVADHDRSVERTGSGNALSGSRLSNSRRSRGTASAGTLGALSTVWSRRGETPSESGPTTPVAGSTYHPTGAPSG